MLDVTDCHLPARLPEDVAAGLTPTICIEHVDVAVAEIAAGAVGVDLGEEVADVRNGVIDVGPKPVAAGGAPAGRVVGTTR